MILAVITLLGIRRLMSDSGEVGNLASDEYAIRHPMLGCCPDSEPDGRASGV